MASPRFCNIMSTKEKGVCVIREIDVTGDSIPDRIRVCDDVEVMWKGDAVQCRKELGAIIQSGDYVFKGVSGLFSTPLAFLEMFGLPPSVCKDEVSAVRKRVGLNTVQQGMNVCMLRFYGRQRWFLSYPPPKEKGLGVDDIRNRTIRRLPTFGPYKIGIGTWGKFTTAKGEVIKGIVVQIGFPRPWGRALKDENGKYCRAEFNFDNVNIIIYTVETKTYETNGVKVDLKDIVKFEPLSNNEMTQLAKAYRKAHRSIDELLRDIEKQNRIQGQDSK